MNETSVEMDVEASGAESKALLEALYPESAYGRVRFSVELRPGGLRVRVGAKTLGDARIFAGSVLRLLKAARESIRAVD